MDENEKDYIKVPMTDFLERVYDKQEQMSQSISEINITLAKQHISLDEHMKRSKAAEEAIDLLRSEMKPIEKHVEIVQFVVKLGTVLLSSASVLYIIKYFLK